MKVMGGGFHRWRCIPLQVLTRANASILSRHSNPNLKCKLPTRSLYSLSTPNAVSKWHPCRQHPQTTHPSIAVAHFSSGMDNDEEGSSSSSSNSAFNRNLKLLQRNAAAASARGSWSVPSSPDTEGNNNMADKQESHNEEEEEEEVVDYDYFHREIANRLVDRLDDIKREGGFPLALDIGAGVGHIHRAICSDDAFEGVGGIGGVRKLVQLDSSELMLHRDGTEKEPGEAERCGTYKLVADEEARMPFPDGTFDLVISSTALHWVNDLPHLLSEAKRVLKPDGCLMFAMVGGATLTELRSSLVLAEMERDGGVSPHVGPFVDFSDVGSLLTAAGFTLPTVDIDTIKIGYPNAMVLMEHLQRMGEGNASLKRRDRIGLDTFLAASCIYDEMFKLESGGSDDGDGVEASAQIIYAIGWTPHESQQQPLERGCATRKIGDVEVEQTEAKK